jgi:hypothetical protein
MSALSSVAPRYVVSVAFAGSKPDGHTHVALLRHDEGRGAARLYATLEEARESVRHNFDYFAGLFPFLRGQLLEFSDDTMIKADGDDFLLTKAGTLAFWAHRVN